jgi:uncharacterized membrane protein
MDATHWHLLLNHFPILGTLFGLGLILAGMLRRKPILTNAGLVVFLLLALLTVVVFQTGEIAHEKLYMNVSEASQDWIMIHQKIARQARWMMLGLGMLSALAWWMQWQNHRWQRICLWAVVLVGSLTFGLMAQTGNSGGKIMHPEIRGRNG